MKRFFLLLAAGLLAACGDSSAVQIILPDGFAVSARVADTPQKQARGLMFVKNLPENNAMLFVFEQEQAQLFWMKNTLIDLDIVFIGADKRVISVEHEVPHTYTYTPDYEVPRVSGYGKYVLELSAKTAARHGVENGARLQFSLPEKK